MKSFGLACLMLISICPRVRGADKIYVIVEEQDHPAGVLIASVGGIEVAKIPGAFALAFDGNRDSVVRLTNDFNYMFSLRFSYKGGLLYLVSVFSQCSPVAAHGALGQTGAQKYHLLITYSKEETECPNYVDYGRLKADNSVKIRFVATPAKATIFVHKSYQELDSNLPSILNMEYYQPQTTYTVFFKSEGYLDCPKKLTFTKKGALYEISVDDGSPATITSGNDENEVPTVSCTLTKIP